MIRVLETPYQLEARGFRIIKMPRLCGAIRLTRSPALDLDRPGRRCTHAGSDALRTSTRSRSPLGSRGRRELDLPGPEMLADRKNDLAAAIDDRGIGAREPRIKGDLDNRDRQQRNEEDDHRPHVFPPQQDAAAEATINGGQKIVTSEPYKNVYLRSVGNFNSSLEIEMFAV
jgi:hypothetical protein